MFKHNDDDGDLSIFAGETQLLFVCSKGHYWLLDATQHDVQPPAAESDLAELTSSFGPNLRSALGIEATDIA